MKSTRRPTDFEMQFARVSGVLRDGVEKRNCVLLPRDLVFGTFQNLEHPAFVVLEIEPTPPASQPVKESMKKTILNKLGACKPIPRTCHRLYSKSAIQVIPGNVGFYGTGHEIHDRLPCLDSLAYITR